MDPGYEASQYVQANFVSKCRLHRIIMGRKGAVEILDAEVGSIDAQEAVFVVRKTPCPCFEVNLQERQD